MKYAILFFLSFLIFLCNGQTSPDTIKLPKGIHAVVVREILQTKSYTYLKVNEGDSVKWMALPKMENALIGATYYHGEGGLPMKDFESKELNRKFPAILFVDQVSSSQQLPVRVKQDTLPYQPSAAGANSYHKFKPDSLASIPLEKVKIKQAKDGITIAHLLKNKESYFGKTVKIKGQVVKFSKGIMGKNWIHIEDGSNYKGTIDLTATSLELVKRGDIIIIEGRVALDRDFGSGYKYDIIVEDVKIVQ